MTLTTLANLDTVRLVLWVLVLIVVVLVGGAALMWLRRALLNRPQQGPTGEGLMLADLRDMHRRGEISEAEFERARGVILRQAGVDAPPQTRSPGSGLVGGDDAPRGSRPGGGPTPGRRGTSGSEDRPPEGV